MTSVTLAQLSISMEDGKVTKWLVEDGARVSVGQPVVEVETDKATIEVEAPADGHIRIVAAEGDVVVVDGVLAELDAAATSPESTGEAPPIAAAGAAAEAHTSLAPSSPPPAAPRVGREGPIASPAARRLAREEGVDLASLRGSGPGGRIVARDIEATLPVPGAPAPPAAVASSDRLRDAVVRNITASWQQIPHVHIGGELVADGLVAARTALVPGEPPPTVTDFLVFALARALVDVPELNGVRHPDGSVVRGSSVNLSLAVATADGVVAPVIRDAATLSLSEVVAERRRLVEAARSGTIEGRDLVGGTCTLSNLGAHPVDFFAPVVSGPQVAMVATGRVAERVVAVNGWVAVRSRMWANIAIDHRAADGEAGGRLLAALEQRIAALPGGTR